MLENQTLLDVLVFLLGTGGTLAVLLERIPGWANLNPKVKVAIVTVLGAIAPAVLVLLKVYIPPETLAQTPQQIAVGLATAAVAFVVHQIDAWLEAKKVGARRVAGL